MKLFFFSLLFTLIFGLIDAIIFLIGEESVQKGFKKAGLNQENSELLTGGISATISILIASSILFFLKKSILKNKKLTENPLIDGLGIMLGTLIILLFNLLINKNKKKE